MAFKNILTIIFFCGRGNTTFFVHIKIYKFKPQEVGLSVYCLEFKQSNCK